MDDIKKRLQDASDNCVKAFEKWTGNKKDTDAREAFLDTVHELRKVTSRLEIEVAMSERDSNPQKPMPIPTHRDARSSKGADKKEGKDGNKAKSKPASKGKSEGGNKKAASE